MITSVFAIIWFTIGIIIVAHWLIKGRSIFRKDDIIFLIFISLIAILFGPLGFLALPEL